jgi:hypothetical protein
MGGTCWRRTIQRLARERASSAVEGVAEEAGRAVERDPAAFELCVRSQAPYEAAAVHAFHAFEESSPIIAIVSLDYSLSQHPTHPSDPYDAIKDRNSDPAREARHPRHVRDVIRRLAGSNRSGCASRAFRRRTRLHDFGSIRDVLRALEEA